MPSTAILPQAPAENAPLIAMVGLNDSYREGPIFYDPSSVNKAVKFVVDQANEVTAFPHRSALERLAMKATQVAFWTHEYNLRNPNTQVTSIQPRVEAKGITSPNCKDASIIACQAAKGIGLHAKLLKIEWANGQKHSTVYLAGVGILEGTTGKIYETERFFKHGVIGVSGEKLIPAKVYIEDDEITPEQDILDDQPFLQHERGQLIASINALRVSHPGRNVVISKLVDIDGLLERDAIVRWELSNSSRSYH